MSIIGSLPFTLTNGETADATQVMANFNSIIADVNGGAAENGANASITQLTGLTTPLPVEEGGTGADTFTATALLLGNVTGAVQDGPVAGTAGNLVLDNGTTWTGTQVLSGSYSFAVNAAIPPSAGIHSPAAKTVCIATNGADQFCVGPTGGTYAFLTTGTDKGAGSANFTAYFQSGQQINAIKASAFINGLAGLLTAGFNATVVKNGTGDYTVNFPTAFADANFRAVVSQSNVSGGVAIVSRAAGNVRINAFNTNTGILTDVNVDLICTE
jgi:hypothetical protein